MAPMLQQFWASADQIILEKFGPGCPPTAQLAFDAHKELADECFNNVHPNFTDCEMLANNSDFIDIMNLVRREVLHLDEWSSERFNSECDLYYYDTVYYCQCCGCFSCPKGHCPGT